MATKKKLLQAAAGNAGGAALDVDEVFSTYLYSANNAGLTITNGIDLAGEGGLVWGKSRSATQNHRLYDTEGNGLYSNLTNGSFGSSGRFTANSDGFDLTASSGIVGGSGFGGPDYASWTFRKAPKFFDIVTYTGNGPSNTQNISHNLGSAPGMLVVRATSVADNWHTWHRGFGDNGYIMLNNTNAKSTYADLWDDTAPTDTHFTVSDSCNTNNVTYVAYLFAHNDGDGEFGPDGEQDIIKCGSYTGTGHPSTPSAQQTIELGFEPQWFLTKRTNSGASWQLVDNMRGMASEYRRLYPDNNYAEDYEGDGMIPTPTGIRFTGGQAQHNASGGNYIYIAIRRGPLAPPESATEVFDISHAITTNDAPFPVDFMLSKIMSGGHGYARDRLRGGTKYFLPNTTHGDLGGGDVGFDDMTGTKSSSWGTSFIHYNWKRAPNYMDCVAYSGTGSPNNHAPTLTHNLGAVPEMLWVKKRSGTSNWAVVVKSGTGGVQAYLDLNNGNVGTLATTGPSNTWSDYFTSTQVIGDGGSGSAFHSPFPVTHLNVSGSTYIMYLFASLDGISKVGSYTGNGSFQTIDCGFSAGSRFVLIKRTDATGDWYLWDSERGISLAADPYLKLNTTAAETTGSKNYLYPANSGFGVMEINGTNNPNINVSGATYIFYAIA